MLEMCKNGYSSKMYVHSTHPFSPYIEIKLQNSQLSKISFCDVTKQWISIYPYPAPSIHAQVLRSVSAHATFEMSCNMRQPFSKRTPERFVAFG